MFAAYRSSALAWYGVLIIGLMAMPLGVAASQVVPMSIETMADYAGQALVGEVASVRSYWAEDPRRIESEVIFRNTEYLKGALPDSSATFALVVPGGTVGDTHVQVCCTPTFSPGEKWVLLLLPTYQTYPVVGLYQGAFSIRRDAEGTERVYYMRHDVLEPVRAVDAEGFVQVVQGPAVAAHDRLVSSDRLHLRPDSPGAGQSAPAMSYDELLARLRPALAASRDLRLTFPSGRRGGVAPPAVLPVASPVEQAVSRSSAGAGESKPTTERPPATEVHVPRRPSPVNQGGSDQ
jgi:hypothetical protein